MSYTFYKYDLYVKERICFAGAHYVSLILSCSHIAYLPHVILYYGDKLCYCQVSQLIDQIHENYQLSHTGSMIVYYYKIRQLRNNLYTLFCWCFFNSSIIIISSDQNSIRQWHDIFRSQFLIMEVIKYLLNSCTNTLFTFFLWLWNP